MAIQQISESVQNDGNFNQLDLKDVGFNGPTMRIETFRASQPSGEFGITNAGTKVEHLTGSDNLKDYSNKTFRHIFSVEDNDELKVTLEIRESFEENGSWKIRIRDIDEISPSYGAILIVNITPSKGRNGDLYDLSYILREPQISNKTKITSPLTDQISKLNPELAEINALENTLGEVAFTPLNGTINWKSSRVETEKFFQSFSKELDAEKYAVFTKNVQDYQRFGDFRDKCIHPGINLTGSNPQLSSEFVMIRAYRASLIAGGRVFDNKMAKRDYLESGFTLWNTSNPTEYDSKPGVYTPFLLGYILNIEWYQLGIDKVHSDYGGVPMKLAPGSKLENGIDAIVDSTRANKTLAELAIAFYEPDALNNIA